MKTVIICEKPSLAKTVAQSLKAFKSDKDYYYNDNGLFVTSVFGHMLELCDVSDYISPNQKVNWNDIPIPFVPNFRYKIKSDSGISQRLKIIASLIKDSDIVVNCGDADREGQIIVDNLLSHLKFDMNKVKRLWLPSQTEEAIRDAYSNMKNNNDYINLRNEGTTRTYMDWLFGINLTVYTTNKAKTLLNVGRVLVPIVTYIYNRDNEIRNFIPEPYFNVESEIPVKLICSDKFKHKDLAINKANELNLIGSGFVTDITNKTATVNPNRLFSLSTLQRFMSTKFGYTADKTEKILQKLYESALVSYPRTNTEYLATKDKDMIKSIIKAHSSKHTDLTFKESKSLFDDSKIDSHSALTPTTKTDISKLDSEELNVYNSIANRFYANFCSETTEISKSTMTLQVKGEIFKVNGTKIIKEG